MPHNQSVTVCWGTARFRSAAAFVLFVGTAVGAQGQDAAHVTPRSNRPEFAVSATPDTGGQKEQGVPGRNQRQGVAIGAPVPVGVVWSGRFRLASSTDPLGRVEAVNGSAAEPVSGSGKLAHSSGSSAGIANSFQDKLPRAPWYAPLSSLVVPGSGQALLRQQRSVAYLVAEAFLVIRSQRSFRAYQNAIDRYRALASDVARVSFGTDRPVGPWEYYEEMEKYEASGVFSSGSQGQLVPETDVSTFNGRQWELAREQFWADPRVSPALNSPEYLRAIAYYQQRAVQGSFRWSWRDHSLEHTAFRETINESNQSNQRYVTAVGFVAANHLVSLIDAYVTVRLRRYGGAGLAAASLNTQLLPMGVHGDRGYGMAVGVTIPGIGLR